ncbi:unnamed protein product, partial [Musa textilis]
IGVGTVVLRLLENLDWMNAVYLSVMLVTTIGYRDRSFNTTHGQIFVSTAVGKAFLYLVEAQIDKRHRRRRRRSERMRRPGVSTLSLDSGKKKLLLNARALIPC